MSGVQDPAIEATAGPTPDQACSSSPPLPVLMLVGKPTGLTVRQILITDYNFHHTDDQLKLTSATSRVASVQLFFPLSSQRAVFPPLLVSRKI